MPWSSQPIPYASTFMTPPAWPMYMPSYMPRPPTQLPFMQAQFKELAWQRKDIEARELEVQRMSQTHNLNSVRDARIRSATSVRGNKHTRGKEQAPGHASSQLASQRSQTPLGAPPSWMEVISTGISQTVAPPPAGSQDGDSQNVEAMVQDLVKSSLTQLGVIPQETLDQSQAQSDTVDPGPPQIEDISFEGEISKSDLEDHSGTFVLNKLLMAQEELEDYDYFQSPVVTKTPLWKFPQQTLSGSQAQTKTKTKTVTAQAHPMTSTPVKPPAP